MPRPVAPSIFAHGQRQALFQSIQREVALVARDDQRGAEPQGIVTGAQNEQAAFEGQIHHAVAQLRRFGLGLLVAHQLDAQHQAQPAHLAHDGEARRPIPHARHQVRAHARGVIDQLLLQQLDGHQRRRVVYSAYILTWPPTSPTRSGKRTISTPASPKSSPIRTNPRKITRCAATFARWARFSDKFWWSSPAKTYSNPWKNCGVC